MATESRLNRLWKYLHTSHGTHRVVTDVDEGYYCTPEPSVVPNRTPLQKIVLTAIGASILVLSYGVFDYMRDEERKTRERGTQFIERIVPNPIGLEFIVEGSPVPFGLDAERIEDYRQKIREKLEKGYLTPSHEYYKRYEKIFGNEPWWQEHESKELERDK